MICPNCGYDNLPGVETCKHCEMDLTQLDLPSANSRIERSLMEDTVSSLKPRPPVSVTPETTVGQVVKTMLDTNVGALLIVDAEGKLEGVFSERDLVARVAGIAGNWEDQPIRDFMTRRPETVQLTDTLAFALHKMDVGGYRHLPVVKEGKPMGVISVRDMLRYLTRLC